VQKTPDINFHGIPDVFVFTLTMTPVSAFIPKIFIKTIDVSQIFSDLPFLP